MRIRLALASTSAAVTLLGLVGPLGPAGADPGPISGSPAVMLPQPADELQGVCQDDCPVPDPDPDPQPTVPEGPGRLVNPTAPPSCDDVPVGHCPVPDPDPDPQPTVPEGPGRLVNPTAPPSCDDLPVGHCDEGDGGGEDPGEGSGGDGGAGSSAIDRPVIGTPNFTG
ncbi:MAG: hypothetical protein ACK5PP_14070 [Acidimicrobiales bacterium]